MILCAGEALIDLIPDAKGVRQPFVGGAVLNTAVALGRLGVEVGLITGLSSDEHGRLIEKALADSHVSTDFAVRSDRPTTLAVVSFVDGHASYEFRDAGSALRDLKLSDLPDPHPETSALFYGGISLCNPPVADALAQHCAAHAGGRLTMIDPNLRPGFADEPDAYVMRLRKILSQADVVKVSDDDLELLYPGETRETGVSTLLSSGPRVVLLTLGAAGAQAIHTNGCEVTVPGQNVQVADTVGAGDTFNAGVLARAFETGLSDKGGIDQWSAEQMADLLRFGTAAAAVTVSRSGANPPWKHEMPAHLT